MRSRGQKSQSCFHENCGDNYRRHEITERVDVHVDGGRRRKNEDPTRRREKFPCFSVSTLLLLVDPLLYNYLSPSPLPPPFPSHSGFSFPLALTPRYPSGDPRC
ncbi:hypothetical protein K1719_003993 [Acacia pycnantha]|nr:hypothetical protein K1719_003993 [Acacia pycnantha]